MKNRILPIATLLFVIILLVASVFGMLAVQKKHSEEQKKQAGPRDMAVPVQTGRVGRARIDEILTFNGDVLANKTVDIQPKISGRLATLAIDGEIPIAEGTRVEKGQRIASIEDREWKAQLANARAALAVAKAEVVSSKAALANAKASAEQQQAAFQSSTAAVEAAQVIRGDKQREMQRQKKLIELQATTQQSYDQAEAAAAQADAEYDKAVAARKAAEAQVRSAEAAILQAEAGIVRSEANVTQAEAALNQAEINDSETLLYAPMSGVISRKLVDPGAMVSPTTSIVTLVEIDTVRIVLSIPVNHLPRMVPGKTKARLRTASLPGQQIECVIQKIYPVVDLTTRTAQVEITLKNEVDAAGDYKLKPGMYVTVEVLIQTRENVIAVDTALPIRNLERNIVYRTDGDKVRAIDAKLGVRFEGKVEILSGLQEGDEVVVVGQHRLTDGATIRRIEGNNMKLQQKQ